MKLSLVKCRSEDIDQLREIGMRTFSDAFESQNNPDDFSFYIEKAFGREQLLSEINHPHSQFYFAKTDDTILGYFKLNFMDAQTDLKDTRAAELERIYVCKEYQGRKIGKWMLDRAVEIARALGKSYIWLGVWEENTGAIAFYEKSGFKKFGKHPYYIGKDRQIDWLMKLEFK